jgi:membrane protein DedA with SNARE-associated domain
MDFLLNALVYVADYSYVGIFFALLLSGYLLPIPEEVLLFLVGYLISVDIINPYLGIAVAFLGVLIGDNALFLLSLHNSKYTRKLKDKIVELPFLKEREVTHQNIGKAIFFTRFIIGLRFLGPIFAGTMKVTWRYFLFYNTSALVIYTVAIVFLGYHFSEAFVEVVICIAAVRHSISVLFMLLLAVAVTIYAHKRFYKRV